MDSREAKRRRRERVIIVITILVIVVMTYIESHLSKVEALLPLSSEVLIFGLININVSLIILLIFLIVRNIAKLIFERRKGILGSKLRTKLVIAFVSLSLIPTVVLFLFSSQFLSYSIDNWFNIKTGNALNLSLEVAQTYYQQSADNAKYYAKQISAEITENRFYEKELFPYLKILIEQRLNSFDVGSIEISFDNSKENVQVKEPGLLDIPPVKFSPKVTEDIFMGKELSTVQSIGIGELVVGIAPLFSNFSPREVIGAVAVSIFVSNELIDKMAVISKTSEEYRQLGLLKTPIKVSYIITLFIVTLLIIFSATWFGIFLAKGITEPIQDLAEATHEISHGNLDYHIDLLADDEIGVLVNSFNQMTVDLKKSSESLKRANEDLEQRRKYMETVLGNVSGGVIAIDKLGMISTINRSAEKMLGIESDSVLSRHFREILKPEYLTLVRQILREMKEHRFDSIEKQVQLFLKDKVVVMLVSLTILRDDDDDYIGMVAVLEDITQLQKAERIAAWREVARRIAHEIKNPLTPVKLCTERLQRKYGDKIDGDEGLVFRECTRTIIGQVDALKNLVNEFSRFARMPVTNLSPNDLNAVIHDAVILFQDAHINNVEFSFKKDNAVPSLSIDAEQIKRVMVNLLDNAVAAIMMTSAKSGIIEIETAYSRANKKARVSVRDNGIGIAPENKLKLCEPYFSTKKSGTGLGLAIVSSIISDHNGILTIQDNNPRGTVVSFEIPAA